MICKQDNFKKIVKITLAAISAPVISELHRIINSGISVTYINTSNNIVICNVFMGLDEYCEFFRKNVRD